MNEKSAIAYIVAAALGLSLPAVGAEPRVKASAAPQRTEVEIRDPGRTGLAPGRYVLELEASGSGPGREQIVVLILSAYAAPAGPKHRFPGQAPGCDASDLAGGGAPWRARVSSQPDGSLRLVLVSRSDRRCRIAATIPEGFDPPGIEGSPIGTVGKPPEPGIEGTDVGTGAAPPAPPPIAGRGTHQADREIERLIAHARQALGRLACAEPGSEAEALLAPILSALQAVAGAASPAAAVEPLRRFEAAVAALEKGLAADRVHAEGARRCAAAERRCAAAGSPGAGCRIDAAVCLAAVLCASG